MPSTPSSPRSVGTTRRGSAAGCGRSTAAQAPARGPAAPRRWSRPACVTHSTSSVGRGPATLGRGAGRVPGRGALSPRKASYVPCSSPSCLTLAFFCRCCGRAAPPLQPCGGASPREPGAPPYAHAAALHVGAPCGVEPLQTRDHHGIPWRLLGSRTKRLGQHTAVALVVVGRRGGREEGVGGGEGESGEGERGCVWEGEAAAASTALGVWPSSSSWCTISPSASSRMQEFCPMVMGSMVFSLVARDAIQAALLSDEITRRSGNTCLVSSIALCSRQSCPWASSSSSEASAPPPCLCPIPSWFGG